ncbi:MAG: filamentous hemagglutinin N-terminal domain-containing protein [Cyanobacteriota bacterium]|nr:filamentous hemagglutinin N-terminal domain-containing protein [Cyanobacteriota bacterium]
MKLSTRAKLIREIKQARRLFYGQILVQIFLPTYLLSFGSSALAIGMAIAATTSARAQIVPDNSLPNNTTVNIENQLHRIAGGTTINNNLFHSFREFSLKTGNTAFFDNSPAINNIFSRVTGGNISNIDGIIRANGSANLFLINPNGIIFGPNARLNIGGSLIGSTAMSVIFDDGSFFSATNPDGPPLLNVNVPIGLQLGTNPAEIVVTGPGHNIEVNPATGIITENNPVGLEVLPAQSLTLLGGNVTLDGANLSALEGRVEIGSVGGGDRVTLTPSNTGFQLGYAGVSNFGQIRLLNATGVNASGSARLRGQNISLRDGSVILTKTSGSQARGTLSLEATDTVEIIGTSDRGLTSSGLLVDNVSTANSNGGNILISTSNLLVAEGGRILNATNGAGNAGSLTVRATDTVELTGTSPGGSPSSLLAGVLAPNATGNGGSISIFTSKLRVTDGAQIAIATIGAGDAGSLSVEATESVEIIGTRPDGNPGAVFAGALSPEATGSGGNITISTSKLLIADGARISLATGSLGNAGSLRLQANDVEILGTSPDGSDRSGIFAGVGENGRGNGGDVRIVTSRLRIAEGGTLEVSTNSSGNAGELTVEARDFVEISGEPGDISVLEELDNINFVVPAADILLENPSVLAIIDRPGILAGTTGTGDGGNVTIVTPRLRLDDRAIIGVGTTSAGRGGNATISTNQLQIVDGSGIVAPALSSGDAGELTVLGSDRLELSGDSILAAGTNSTGNAGSVNIQGGRLTLRDKGVVSVVASGEGNPGSITIAAEDLLLDGGGILAASETGKGGNISLRSPNIQLRQGGQISAAGSSTGNITQEGNINIEAATLVLLGGSAIVTDAEDVRGGSNIAIAPLLASDLIILQSPDSTINAVGELQIATGIEIQPGEGLNIEVTDVADLIDRDLCSEEARQSSFTTVGKGGLPPNPTQQANNFRPIVEWASPEEGRSRSVADATSLSTEQPNSTATVTTTQAPLVEATGWIVTPEGKILLVADTRTAAANPVFAHPGCR